MSRVLVMGASGRLGAYLRQFWPGDGTDILWQYRAKPPDGAVHWSPLTEPAPACGPLDAVLCLSGVTHGPSLGLNTDLALAALGAAHKLGARRVLLASSAAVYGARPGPHAETAACSPATPYGVAKLAMEHAALSQAGALNVTCLRIGNVAGADALLGGLQPGGLPCLNQCADGRAPRRSYIGPRMLAGVLARLVSCPGPLPPVLNLAQPGAVDMAALLKAAGCGWTWRPAPASALPELLLDTSRLQGLCPVSPASAPALIAEWRATWAGRWAGSWAGERGTGGA